MSFLDTIERARAFLERNGRVSLRVLKREFELDDEALEELVEELVDVQQVAAREGKVLAWLSDHGTIVHRAYDDDGTVAVRVRLGPADLARAGRMVEALESGNGSD